MEKVCWLFVWAAYFGGIIVGVVSWLIAFNNFGGPKETEAIAEQMFWNGVSAFEVVAWMSLGLLILEELSDIRFSIREANKKPAKVNVSVSRNRLCVSCGRSTTENYCCGTRTNPA